MNTSARAFNGAYEGEHLNHVAFPLGGIGAGMICLEGAGGFNHISLRHRPAVNNQPVIFAALAVKGAGTGGNIGRVLEGPVPAYKIFGQADCGMGLGTHHYGLPRFERARFEARFPFANVTLDDPKVPVRATITGWSPFIPGDANASSLPVAALEYTLTNTSRAPVATVFSFHSRNFMAGTKVPCNRVDATPNGFVLHQPGTSELPWEEGSLAVMIDDPAATADCAWFRGGWYDALTYVWNKIERAEAPSRPPHAGGDPSPGGSAYLPVALEPGESKTVRVLISWFVPHSDVAIDSLTSGRVERADQPHYQPWYVSRFDGISAVASYWRANYNDLRSRSKAFTDCFYDSTLPPEVMEAVAANLGILKSPTMMRQPDGQLWAFEGCGDKEGCCFGSCTHVWNYAQAIPHLFPDLERTLRESEFNIAQDDKGHQQFRVALPIHPIEHNFHAAADGQLGGIMKAYREWRINGDDAWLKRLWPRVKQSLDYCITAWDPKGKGMLEEPHHNTYDIEFWGPDGMCTSIYAGALAAACKMGEAFDANVDRYRALLAKSRAAMERELYNGEYFIQHVVWEGLNTKPTEISGMVGKYSDEAIELLKKEGPKYQYGAGCLSDGVLGAWFALVCGLGQDVIDAEKVRSHLRAVHRNNFKPDLSEHPNPQRPGYALGHDGGVILCSWPRGGMPLLPFPYSNEVWTGIEYQVASHLMSDGMVDEGLDIVRAARTRHDGRVRNPFDEYECGHWYARAMSSYAMLQALSGVRYDAVDRVLYVAPSIKGDFRAFVSTATGFGTSGVRDGRAFLDVKQGSIPVKRIAYTPCAARL